MLRLLAQREQGYDDIAALMGISVAEVRERVKDALGQLEAEGKAPPEELRAAGPVTEGSGEPTPAGPVTETGPSSSQAAGEDPISAPPAGEASAEAAKQPRIAKKAKPARQSRPNASLPSLSLPESGGARAAIAAGVVALVVLVVVLVVGGGGDGGSEATTASNGSAASGAEGEPTSGNVKKLTKAVLKPVDGSEASGVAVFGRFKNRLALQVGAEGLEPTASGQSYAIWMAESPQKMLPLASTAVGQDGQIGAQFEVPTEVLGYLANETFDQIVVTEVVDSQLEAAVNKATSEKKAPDYTGTAVLEGQITGPIIGAAKKKG